MGQATVDSAVDLPDPLESRGENADATQAQSADDLLSQLAGDEIDRLLAASDSDPAEETHTPTAEVVETKTAPAVGTPVPASIPRPVAKAPTAPSLKKTPLEEEMDLDAAIDAAARERMAIRGSGHEEVIDHSPQINLGDPVRRLPLFLRPLEWLSAPLDPWPDQIRDLIGKVGLMTLVNALAVLAYVLIFRHHHHH
jgi:hypothetical protein